MYQTPMKVVFTNQGHTHVDGLGEGIYNFSYPDNLLQQWMICEATTATRWRILYGSGLCTC